jgi:hypothetical protein
MRRHICRVALAAVMFLLPATTWAQGSAEKPWGPGTTLAVFGGAASADSRVVGALSGTLGWEWKPSFAVEGNGTWFTESHGVSAFAALLGPRLSLTAPGSFVPTIFAGVGMFRSSVNFSEPNVPGFYRNRVDMVGSPVTTRVFEDFLFAVGGGADVFVNAHLAIRPDVRVLFVHGDSDTRIIPTFGAHVTYHFEAHPYLP